MNNKYIETALSHIAKFAPFEEKSGASHFPIYNTGTFDFKNKKLVEKFIKNTKIFGEKCSFDSPDSRIEIPAKTSHASFSKKELATINISRNTIRFSIGLENVKDLIKDIKQALN